MFARALFLALALIPAVLAAAEPAFAQRGRGRAERDVHQPFLVQQGSPFASQWDKPQQDPPQREVPLNTILRDLRRQYGGQHLDATKNGNRWIIAWVTGDGKRLTIEVDAVSGRVISTRG